MKQQVFLIHGGEAFNTYEDYLGWLKKLAIDFDEFISVKKPGWKGTLAEKLGGEYEVIAPRMPNPLNAKYAEWKIYFEKFIPFLRDDIILVGHSLGGIFLAKYLSEERFPHRVTATFLVAAPCNTASEHPLSDFILGQNLDVFAEQSEIIVMYHSKDDEVVPFSNLDCYGRMLPGARVEIFEDRGHFNQEEFPELLQAIASLRKN